MSHASRLSFGLVLALFLSLFSLHAVADPASLRKTAHDYYQWRDAAYPVATSAQGDHRLDDRLTDYRMPAVLERRQHVSALLDDIGAAQTEGWSKDPAVFTVLIEDFAALLGLAVAFIGVFLGHLLENPYIDGAASIGIGLILAAAAVGLAHESRSLLVGESASPVVVADICKIASSDRAVQTARTPLTMHLGPQDILVAATLDFRDDLTAVQLEQAADELTGQLRKAEPRITRVFIRPGEAVWSNDDGSRKGL